MVDKHTSMEILYFFVDSFGEETKPIDIIL